MSSTATETITGHKTLTAANPQQPRLITKSDILTAPIPPDFRPLILYHHGRIRHTLASEANTMQKRIAADQLGKMSVVYHAYTNEGTIVDESDAMVMDLVDASLCSSTGIFSCPPCLHGRESEVEVLFGACIGDKNVRKPRLLSEMDDGLRRPSLSRSVTWPNVETLGGILHAHIDWPHPLRRRRSEGDMLHAADRRSHTHQSSAAVIDEHTGVQCTAHAGPGALPSTTARMYKALSRHIRAAIHPWCLRCFRQRRLLAPDQSRIRNFADWSFMLLGAAVIVVVEMSIAFTDGRTQKKAGTSAKLGKSWTLFLDSEVGPQIFWEEDQEEALEEDEETYVALRHRSLSCAF